jgi:hypothetical protein
MLTGGCGFIVVIISVFATLNGLLLGASNDLTEGLFGLGIGNGVGLSSLLDVLGLSLSSVLTLAAVWLSSTSASKPMFLCCASTTLRIILSAR